MSLTCGRVRQSLIGMLPEGDALREADQSHLSGCAACNLWWARRNLWVRSLSERLVVPEELDARVALVAEPESRRERVLASVQGLEALRAPEELEARVRRDLVSTTVTRALEGLEVLRAPDVLERLVREELADPAAASVRRHAGALARLKAPVELARATNARLSVQERNRSHSPSVGRRRVLASLALAAAAVVAWAVAPGTRLGSRQAAERTWSFTVVHGSLDDNLGSMGFELADALAGGVATASEVGGQR